MTRRLRVDKSYLFYDAWRLLAADRAEPVAEYPFSKVLGRRHRFDWAFVPERVGVEVDGGVWSANGGRHASDTDREKLNLAASLRWLVFRFSPQMLERDPAGCVELVVKALEDQSEH